MSGTFTVKELIKELLEFDMNDPVFIALGKDSTKPEGSSKIFLVNDFNSNITCGFGVYIHPNDELVDKDKIGD